MVGEHCNRQCTGSEDTSIEQDMDCDQCLYIDESSRQSVAENACSSNSGHSSPTDSDSDRVHPESKSVIVDLFRNGKSSTSLPKNPKSSLSKLESLVSNLMQRKTEKLAKMNSLENGLHSVAVSQNNVCTSSVGRSVEVIKVPHKSTPNKATKPSITKVSEVSSHSRPAPLNVRSFPRIPAVNHDLPAVPQITHVPGLPPMMPGGMLPFMSPFGFSPFMMPLGMPCMPPVPNMPCRSEMKMTPPKISQIYPSDDMPLDLTTTGKKYRPEPGFPNHDISRLAANSLHNSTTESHSGLLQVHIPQLVKPNQTVTISATVSSPKPSILPRSGKSAFMNVASPIIKSEKMMFKKDSSSTCPLDMTAAQNIHAKEISVYEHNVLQTDFLEAARKPKTGAAIRRLQQAYRQEVDRIEIDRHKMMVAVGDPQKGELMAMFDNQRLLLTKQYRVELAQEKLKFGMKSNQSPGEQMPALPQVMSYSGIPVNGPIFPSPVMPFAPTLPSHTLSQMTPADQWQQNHLGSFAVKNESHSPSSSNDSSSGGELNSGDMPDEGQRSQKRKFLCPSAVSILNHWYESHFDHPYPDETTVDDLAKQGNITPPQVKKWMANKRVRSCNTLAFNGSIHPKKLQKLMQLKESSMQVSDLEEATPPMTKMTLSEKKSKRLLNPQAVDYMNNWYAEHLNYPYPTEDEKSRIASEAGLSLPQVTCWFANKRNRSNNTRRISTKTMWQKLNRKMEILDAMKMNSESSSLSMMVDIPVETNSVV